MRASLYNCLLITLVIHFGQAMAVTPQEFKKFQSGRNAPSSVPEKAEPSNSAFKVDIPVYWQMTRARLVGSGASTLTESYRETWTLEVRSAGMSYLSSPRTRVQVYASGVRYPTKTDASTTIPISVDSIAVSQMDFAALVGIPSSPDETEDFDAAKLVTLNLVHRNGTDVTLNLSEEEHFAVHLELGNNASIF